jgi:hypothetical protein
MTLGAAVALGVGNWAMIFCPREPVAPDEALEGAGDLTATVCPLTGLPISPGCSASGQAMAILASVRDPFTRPKKV